MNIYISCDMEGVAGVSSWQQVDTRNHPPEYFIYQQYMTDEVAAAIDGARSAGAREVLINDSHGTMRNMLFDRLPDDVRVIFGNRKPLSMVEGMNREYGGVFFTGYHGAIGDQNATLGHTYTPSVVYEARINGVVCSEATINAGLAGFYGVPVLLVTGDRVTVEGVQAQMPWVHGVIVKESIGYFSTDSVSPARAQAMIREGAAHAVRNAQNARPFVFDPPVTLEIDLARVEQADYVELIPGFVRTRARTAQFTHDDYPTIFRAFVAAFRMGALA